MELHIAQLAIAVFGFITVIISKRCKEYRIKIFALYFVLAVYSSWGLATDWLLHIDHYHHWESVRIVENWKVEITHKHHTPDEWVIVFFMSWLALLHWRVSRKKKCNNELTKSYEWS